MCESSATRDTFGKQGDRCQCEPVGCGMRQTSRQMGSGARGQNEAPAGVPKFAASGAGAWSSPLGQKKVSTRRHNHDEEGANVHESTRNLRQPDSGLSVSAVNITPASSEQATVTTTPTVA